MKCNKCQREGMRITPNERYYHCENCDNLVPYHPEPAKDERFVCVNSMVG